MRNINQRWEVTCPPSRAVGYETGTHVQQCMLGAQSGCQWVPNSAGHFEPGTERTPGFT